MTYFVNDEDDDCVVPELKLRVGVENGDYVKLRESEGCEPEGFDGGEAPQPSSSMGRWWWVWWWAKVVVLLIFVGVLAVVFLKWVGPFFMDKVLLTLFLSLHKFRYM